MIKKRKIFQAIRNHLAREEITLITGARQVGKTTLMRQLQASLNEEGKLTTFLNLEIIETLALLDKNPENVWKFMERGEKQKQYLFIDEIQYLKNPSNFLKHLYDEYRDEIKIIVSGSSAFYIDQKFTDSLAGRKRLFLMRSLSFAEYLDFQDEENLAEKIEKRKTLLHPEKKKIQDAYDTYMIYGGYPKVALAKHSEKQDVLGEIVNAYLKKDIDEQGIKNSGQFLDLLRVLANQTGSLINILELSGSLGITMPNIHKYMQLLQKTFYIQPVRPFHSNIRKELTKMPKCYFLDSGVRNYLTKDMRNIEFRSDQGALLEQEVFVELSHAYDDENAIQFWRTKNGNEVDFVVERKNAFEVKYNASAIAESKYTPWKKAYPNIPVSFVTYIEKEGRRTLKPWEV